MIGRAEIRDCISTNQELGYTQIQLPPFHFGTGRVRYDIPPHMVREENFLFCFVFDFGLFDRGFLCLTLH